jgi:hypothetical protein
VRVPNGAIGNILNSLAELAWVTGEFDVLGCIHSHLLSRKLDVLAGSVCIEDDPFPRKTGGVFYTPEHIVRYMVDRTLGRWLYKTDNGQPDGRPMNRKRPRPISDLRGLGRQTGLRVLDPAMGSGVFLCYAFKVLADYYTRAAPSGTLNQHIGHIIREHLYGVDVDNGAVGLAEINLLVTALEYCKQEGITANTESLVDANLRVGNSLISYDIGEQRNLARSEELQPFNWEEDFPEVFDPNLPESERGFTVVIGNPPYVFGEHIPADEKPYLESHYEMARGQYDLYWLFYERSINLLKEGGRHSFVVPDALTVRDEARHIRKMLVNRGQLQDVARVGTAFTEPEVSTVVTVWQKSRNGSSAVNIDHIDCAGHSSVDQIGQHSLAIPPSYRFSILVPNELQETFARMRSRSTPLSDHVSISRGEELGKRGLHKLADGIPVNQAPILVGEDVSSFEPCLPRHLIEKDKIRKELSLYNQAKIVVVKTGESLKATLDTNGFCTLQSLYNLVPRRSDTDLRILLAIMLSTPMQVYLWRTYTGYKEVFPQITQSHLGQLPIPWPGIDIADPVPTHKTLIRLSQRMLDLSETRQAVAAAASNVLGACSSTTSSLRTYIESLNGLVRLQPLTDNKQEGEVARITIEEQADGLLVRARFVAKEGAAVGRRWSGSNEEWQDVVRLTTVERDLHLYLLVALKLFLEQNRRKRVWSRGKLMDGILQAVKLPQLPAAAAPEMLDCVRRALPIELPHQEVGLDEEGTPLHLTAIEDDLNTTRSEIDQHVYRLFGLDADEQASLNYYRYTKY